jgi:hypothetical protein
MIQRFLAAAVGLAIGASAAQAIEVWQGEAVIDSATGECTADIAVGLGPQRVLKSILRPKDVEDNGPNTTVSFLANQTTMFALVLDHGAMPNGTGRAFGNDSSGLIKADVGTVYTAFVQQPTTIVLATEDATLQGRIKNFLYIAGCTVTFRAAYSKRT